MLSTKLFDSLKMNENEDLTTLFDSFDTYFQAYLILISHEENTDSVFELCSNWIDKNEEELYSFNLFDINDKIMFACIACEAEEIKAFANTVIDNLYSPTHISVFNHNCLGEAKETFKWAAQLLEETIEESNGKSALAINDFEDQKNWPGINRYI